MREIKFRGKRTDGKGWAFGDLEHEAFDETSKVLPIAIRQKIKGYYSYPIEVISETVGQFTGLQDKNGVDIYEGDILKIHHEYYDIRFAETAFCLFGRFGMWGSVARMIAVCKDIEAEIHVVGNIHDNPELLK